MSITIGLQGSLRTERDEDSIAVPRVIKAWALLACLLHTRQPPSRRKLADLLFADADDPLGALRWSLAQIRRALQQPGALRGDPVELALEPGIEVDLRCVRSTALPEADDLDRFTGELLEGMSFGASSAFEAWLTVERCHFAATAQALLLERAQAELGAGRPAIAARLATCLLELNPLEELHHELLVRSLVAAGDNDAALARVEACETLLPRDLGSGPVSRLREIVPAAGDGRSNAVGGLAAARGQLDAGKAAIGAGAIDVGLESLRRACAAAESCGDDYLHAQARLALGSALVHAMRAYGEAAVALHKAIEGARRIGANAIAATAHPEVGFGDVQASRRAGGGGKVDRVPAFPGGNARAGRSSGKARRAGRRGARACLHHRVPDRRSLLGGHRLPRTRSGRGRARKGPAGACLAHGWARPLHSHRASIPVDPWLGSRRDVLHRSSRRARGGLDRRARIARVAHRHARAPAPRLCAPCPPR